MARVRVGISGWRYSPWRGDFYPKGLTQKRELEYASRKLSTIEINGSFYALQRPSSYRLWYATTPDQFVFSVKANRYITHVKRLNGVEEALANFYASGVLLLREKLGPFLWQFPPSFAWEATRMSAFFDLLPHDTKEAAALARAHNLKEDQAYTRADLDRPIRHAIEVRHKSFENEEFIELLRKHRIALVVADTAGKWPFMEDVTSDFIYVRLHGDEKLYVSGYNDIALQNWASKVDDWAEGKTPAKAKLLTEPAADRKSGRDVFVYFDNDVKVRAPFDAMALAEMAKAEKAYGWNEELGASKKTPSP